MTRPARLLSPGLVIASPGGRAVVTGVEVERVLVRVEYRDAAGPAVVFLRHEHQVWVRPEPPGAGRTPPGSAPE